MCNTGCIRIPKSFAYSPSVVGFIAGIELYNFSFFVKVVSINLYSFLAYITFDLSYLHNY
jgi:hypothetical protein